MPISKKKLNIFWLIPVALIIGFGLAVILASNVPTPAISVLPVATQLLPAKSSLIVRTKVASSTFHTKSNLTTKVSSDSVKTFYEAIDNDDVAKVNSMLNANPYLLSNVSPDNLRFGVPPLIEAIDKLDILRVLLTHGADANIKSSLQTGRQTALHFASHDGDLATVKLLIAHGADVSAKTPAGETPLHMVTMEPDDSNAVSNQAKIALMLIKNGADVNAKDNVGETPLHEASESNRIDIAKVLVANGADVNAQDNAGTTPYAMGNDDMQAFLSRHGATAQ